MNIYLYIYIYTEHNTANKNERLVKHNQGQTIDNDNNKKGTSLASGQPHAAGPPVVYQL